MVLHWGAGHHDDGTVTGGSTKGTETYAFEEVHGAHGEGVQEVRVVEAEGRGEDNDKGGLGVKADATMESIATGKGKEMVRVEDDEGEDRVDMWTEYAEMARVDRVSEHDDSEGSEQDTNEGQTNQAGTDAVKHAQRAGRKETATTQERADDEGLDGSEQDAAGGKQNAAEGEDAAGNEQDVAQDEEDQVEANAVQSRR